MAPLTQEARNAAYARVIKDLGVDRIGTGVGALTLPARPGAAGQRGSALPIEREVFGVQMFEFGEMWSRPGLDYRTRAFVTVAALVGMRATDLLYRHVNIALNLGITPEEIHEVLLHGSVYGGLAAWYNGFAIANEVYVARGILEPGSGLSVTPEPPMDHDQRKEAADRVIAALGVGRIGLDPDAPFIRTMPGGPEFSTARSQTIDEFSKIHGDYGYGEVWGRPGLPLRIRSFVTMALLHVMLESHQLHIHIINALNLGISPDEIQEAQSQVGVYHGSSGWNYADTVCRFAFEQHPAASRMNTGIGSKK
jgi:4-carboxymuconolactone decarboxylase